MSKKRYNPPTVEGSHDGDRVRSAPIIGGALPYKSMFFVACFVIVVLVVLMFIPIGSGGSISKSGDDSEIHNLLGRSYVELGRREVAQDFEEPGYELEYWFWTDRNGAWGYCTEVEVGGGYPSVLMVLDSNIKIVSLIETSDFQVVGTKRQAEFEEALDNYRGRTLMEFTYLETSIPSGDTAEFRGLLRDAVAQAMKVIYIQTNGMDIFNSNFPQGIKFAKVGTELENWSTATADGATITSADYRGRKYAFLATSSCGSCINTVIGVSQRLQNEGRLSPEQIIVIFTSADDKADNLKKRLSGEVLVYDRGQTGFSKQISLTESTPCMMLVNSDGIVAAKAGSRSLDDTSSQDKILENFFGMP